jgi:hypothetical protein
MITKAYGTIQFKSQMMSYGYSRTNMADIVHRNQKVEREWQITKLLDRTFCQHSLC